MFSNHDIDLETLKDERREHYQSVKLSIGKLDLSQKKILLGNGTQLLYSKDFWNIQQSGSDSLLVAWSMCSRFALYCWKAAVCRED